MEDNQVVTPPESTQAPEPVVQQQAPQPPTVEEAAREMGWRPLEEYEGDPDKWVSAQSFVDRKPLFDKIDSQSKRVKALEKSLNDQSAAIRELTEHNKKVAEAAYKKAVADLKAERRAAIRSGDHDLADQLDEQIDNLKPEIPEIKAPEVQPYTAEIKEWMAENPWYEANKELQHIADGFGRAAMSRGLSTPEILVEITRKMKEINPELTRNPNKDKAPPSKAKDHTATAHKASAYRPSPMQVKIAKTFVDQGVFKTVEEYYKQLRDVGEL